MYKHFIQGTFSSSSIISLIIVSDITVWCLAICHNVPLINRGQVTHICASQLTQIARFVWPTWGPPWSCRPQVGPILAPWTLLSGKPSMVQMKACHMFGIKPLCDLRLTQRLYHYWRWFSWLQHCGKIVNGDHHLSVTALVNACTLVIKPQGQNKVLSQHWKTTTSTIT